MIPCLSLFSDLFFSSCLYYIKLLLPTNTTCFAGCMSTCILHLIRPISFLFDCQCSETKRMGVRSTELKTPVVSSCCILWLGW